MSKHDGTYEYWARFIASGLVRLGEGGEGGTDDVECFTASTWGNIK